MAEAQGDEAAITVWVRRCRFCRVRDVAAAFGRLGMLNGPWSCPRCRSDRFDAVQLPLPNACTPAPDSPLGAG